MNDFLIFVGIALVVGVMFHGCTGCIHDERCQRMAKGNIEQYAKCAKDN